MLPEAIIVGLMDVVRSLVLLFPSDSVEWPSGAGIAAALAAAAGTLDGVVPLSEIAGVLEPTIEIIAPVIITARVTLFLYFMTPFVK